MGPLRISLLGTMRVSHGVFPVETKLCSKVKGLLAYLILFRHRVHTREVLAGLFWGNYSDERTHRCLNTALWRLREALEPGEIPHGTYLLTTTSGEVAFDPESHYVLDVEIFEDHVQKILAQPFYDLNAKDVHALENALKLYSGQLLEAFQDDWILQERVRLHSLYLKSQVHLLYYYSYQEAYKQALACGHTILDIDPLREAIHRQMMRLYVYCGQRSMAIRQYERCRSVFEAELDAPPSAETQLLHAQIRRKAFSDRNQRFTQAHIKAAQRTLHRIQRSLPYIDRLTEKLRRANKSLDQITRFQNSL